MSLESRVPEGRGWHKDLAFWTRACRITSGRTGEVSWLMLPSELLLIIMAIHMNPYRSSSGYGLEVQTPKRGLPAQWKPQAGQRAERTAENIARTSVAATVEFQCVRQLPKAGMPGPHLRYAVTGGAAALSIGAGFAVVAWPGDGLGMPR